MHKSRKTIALSLFLIATLVILEVIYLKFFLEKGTEVIRGLPKYGKLTKGTLNPILRVLINGQGHCTAFVIDDNYAMTAAHCLRSDNFFEGLDKTSKFSAITEMGEIQLEAAAINNRIDVGLYKGDFRNFKKLIPDFASFEIENPKDFFVACGYPYSQRVLTCTHFVPAYNIEFYIAGSGMLIPGMSGGPVINLRTGAVIAVNSAAGNGAFMVSPVLGSLGAFGIEPEITGK